MIGADPRQEGALVPLASAAAQAHDAGQVAGRERDAEEDQHRPRDLPDRHREALGVEAEPAGQHREVEPAEQRVGDDLEERVDRDQQRGRLAVGAGEVAPDQHHRDAAGEADDDQPGAVLGLVGQQQPGEREHQQRPDHPVEDQRGDEQAPLGRAACRAPRSGPAPAPGTSSAAGRSRSAGRSHRSPPRRARCRVPGSGRRG